MLFILIVFLFHPFRETFQFDPDEGVELAKARLVLEGHTITGDVWSDQPPLVNLLLAGTFRIFGYSVNIGRLVILGFSAVLMGGAGMLTQLAWGRIARNLVYLLIFMLPFYLQLSVSVMIGMPSIAFAVLAMLAIILWHFKRHWLWLVLAGLGMSLSIFSKLFTGFLPPIFVLGLILGSWSELAWAWEWRKRHFWVSLLGPAAIFSITFVMTLALLVVTLLDPGNISSLVSPHLEAQNQTLLPTSETPAIIQLLKPSVFLILLAVVGFIYSLAQKKWLIFYPAGWALTAFIVLLFHAPVWYHHQMLVTIPAAILAAAAVGYPFTILSNSGTVNSRSLIFLVASLILIPVGWGLSIYLIQFHPDQDAWYQNESFLTIFIVTLVAFSIGLPFQNVWFRARSRLWSLLVFVGCGFLFGWITLSIGTPVFLSLNRPPSFSAYGLHPGSGEMQLLTAMQPYVEEGGLIITDMPMFAFRTRMTVPPELAVVSNKRLRTGNLTEEVFIQAIQRDQPEMVLIARFHLPDILKYVRANGYELLLKVPVQGGRNALLFIRDSQSVGQ